MSQSPLSSVHLSPVCWWRETFGLGYGSCPNNALHPVTDWDPLPNGPTAGSWHVGWLTHTGHGILSSSLLLRSTGFRSPATSLCWALVCHAAPQSGQARQLRDGWRALKAKLNAYDLTGKCSWPYSFQAAFKSSFGMRRMKVKTEILSCWASTRMFTTLAFIQPELRFRPSLSYALASPFVRGRCELVLLLWFTLWSPSLNYLTMVTCKGNADTHRKGCSSANPKHAMETLFTGDQGLG